MKEIEWKIWIWFCFVSIFIIQKYSGNWMWVWFSVHAKGILSHHYRFISNKSTSKKTSWKWKFCHHCIWKNKNKTVYKCSMTLASHANRKVSSMVTPSNLTYTPTSPPPPSSHSMSTRSSPPSLITSVKVSSTVFKVHARSLSTALLYIDMSCWIPFVLGQSDPTVDKHRRQFPCHRFPYHYVPMNHQIKYHFDCHLHLKSYARLVQLYEGHTLCFATSNDVTSLLFTLHHRPVS